MVPVHSLVELLRTRAALQPGRVGYTFLAGEGAEAVRLTYGELDRRARGLAAGLQGLPAPPARALLLHPPGPDYVVAFFGCLYAGVAAAPAYPPRSAQHLPRIRAIAEDLGTAVVLTGSGVLEQVRSRLGGGADGLDWLATDGGEPGGLESAWREPEPDDDSLAFLQYTSGSTAAPRGVMLTHRNLLENSEAIRRAFGHSAASRGVSWLPPYHDMGLIGGILQPLYAGFPVTLLSPSAFLQRPLRWLEAISREGATTSGGPSFAYRLCAERATPEALAELDLRSWEVAFSGAETVRPEVLELFARTFAPCGFRRTAFYPCYGLAESTLLVTGGRKEDPPVLGTFRAAALERGEVVESAEGRTLAGCGRSVPGQTLLVVDPEARTPCPPGRIGEIWVAGPCVAQGYWNRPEATAETFGTRLATGEGPFLRTGDLGFLREDELFVAGRLKDLIVLRGRNHHPQDLEATTAASHPALAPDAGAAFAVEAEGEERLVVVQEVRRTARGQDLAEPAAAIRRVLAEAHGVQVHAVALVRPLAIPRTSSGKIRRRACRDLYLAGALEPLLHAGFPGGGAPGEDAATLREELLALPSGERLPRIAADLRRRVAALARISPEEVDDGLPLPAHGLDSLAASTLAGALVAELGIELPLADLVGPEPLRRLAERAAAALDEAAPRPASPDIEPADELPLTPSQKRFWLLSSLYPASPAWTVAAGLAFRGPLAPARLERSLAAVFQRHEGLGATFHHREGRPFQRLHGPAPRLPLVDLSGLPPGVEPREEMERLRRAVSLPPFDLGAGPLLRPLLLRLAPEEHLLHVCLHHAVCDLASLGVVAEDLAAVYSGRPLAEPRPRLADVVQAPEPHRSWWERRLEGAPGAELPADLPRPLVRGFRGGSVFIPLPAAVRPEASRLCRDLGLTPFMLLFGAAKIALSRWTGQDDLVVGTVAAGRGPGEKRLVSCCVNVLPVRSRLDGCRTVAEALARVRDAVVESLAHSDCPLDILSGRAGTPLPLYDVAFLMQDVGLGGGLPLPGGGTCTVLPWEGRLGTAQLGLRLLVLPTPSGGRELCVEYDAELFRRETAEAFAVFYAGLLERIVEDPGAGLDGFAVPAALPRPEERELLAVAATFTAEPLAAGLGFWMEKLGLHFEVRFASYNQVFQELLDPGGVLAGNRGINAVLVRLEDWLGPASEVPAEELAVVLRGFAGRSAARATLLVFCPPSCRVAADAALRERLLEAEEGLRAVLRGVPGLHAVLSREIEAAYPGEELCEPGADALGHIPYTSEGFAALATVVARRIHAVRSAPYKVVVVDCDNTLWRGVCGEDGPEGIGLGPERLALQRLLVELSDRGVLLALCSKNEERDVREVFARRPDMVLREEHLTAWRIDWRPKPEGLRALAAELELGLDAFVFLDDSPVECAEVRAHLPEVLTLQVPAREAEIPRLLCHVWAFDRPEATGEDRRRTGLYRDNARRNRLRRESSTLEDFLRELDLRVEIRGMAPGEAARVAQLAERTNQLNASGLRRSEAEVLAEVAAGGKECRVVHVRDRFGDYGLVGVLIFGPEGDRLRADTFLLSCRALGRGVEHRMLACLGRTALEQGLAWVEVDFRPSGRNRPARDFLEETAGPIGERGARLSAEAAAAVVHRPASPAARLAQDAAPEAGPPAAWREDAAERARTLARIAEELGRADLVLAAMRRRRARGASAPSDAPRSAAEERLARLWADVLGLDGAGIHDDFFALGGSSVAAVQLAGRAHRMGLAFAPTDVFLHPTIARLAAAASVCGPEAVPPEATAASAELELSPLQRSILAQCLAAPAPGLYVQQIAVRLEGELDPGAFAAAWQALARRHTALRGAFRSDPPSQEIARDASLPVSVLPAGSSLESFLREDRERGFDLARAPLLRVSLLPGSGSVGVVWTFHHLVLDGWSVAVVLEELEALYRGEDLPPAPDFAAWLRWRAGQDTEAADEAWRSELEGAAPTPLDLARPGEPPAGGDPFETRGTRLEGGEMQAVGDLARRARVAPNAVLLGAWALLLARYAGSGDVIFSTAVSGRSGGSSEVPGVERVVGLCAAAVPVRYRFDSGARLSFWLREHQSRHAELRRHESSRAARLPENGRADVLVSVQDLPGAGSAPRRFAGLPITAELSIERTGHPFALDLEPGGATVRATYDARRFHGGAVERLLDQYRALLVGLAAADDPRLDEIPLLTPAERLQSVVAGPPAEGTPWLDVPERLAAQAERTPEAVAAVAGDARWTYRELCERAARAGQALAHRGAGPETLVALVAPRGLDLLASVLGTFHAGGAYLPLDPDTPVLRLRQILDRARPVLVVSAEAARGRVAQALDGLPAERRPPTLPLELLGERESLPRLPAVRSDPRHLAYAIYTSGSTGEPKGALVERRGMVNHLLAKVRDLALTGTDRVAQNAAPTFDISVWQMLAPLLAGGTVAIPGEDEVRDPRALLGFVRGQGVTVLETVPSFLRALLEEIEERREPPPPALRWLLATGEELPPDLAARWLAACPGVPLMNAYGPTECSDDVTHYVVQRAPAPGALRVPVGRPILDTRIVLLGPRLEPVPGGAPGEVCVGGAGVGRGYLDDPARTAEAFVPHPGGAPGERLYRTGDLGRLRPGGAVELLGRRDRQVKVNGYRIELAEIEAALARHPALRESAVALREGRLVAYGVARLSPPSVAELREHLAEHLPRPFLPAEWVWLDDLPLTPNGKVDRKALPAPPPRPIAEVPGGAPRDGWEALLVRLFSEVLQVSPVGVHDDLFVLGGDSISAIQIASRARARGLALSPAQVLRHPTPAALARRAGPGAGAVAEPGPVVGEVGLTPIQLWLLEQELAEPHHFNQAVLLEVAGGPDGNALGAAVASLLHHHDALRLRVAREGGRWRASIAPPDGRAPYAVLDLRALDEAAAARQVELAAAALQGSLDLARGPLVRAALFRCGGGRPDRFLMIIHHLAVDAVSWRILAEDLLAAWEQTARGEPVRLPARTSSIRSWAERLRRYAASDRLDREREHWLEVLRAGAPPLPGEPTAEDAPSGSSTVVSAALDPEETRALLRRLPELRRAEPREALLAATALALSRWTGERRILLDVEAHGRAAVFEDVDPSRTVGWFTSIFPLALDLDGAAGPEAALQATRERLRQVPRDGLGFGVALHLGPEAVSRELRSLPRPRILFNYLGRLDVFPKGSPLDPAAESTGPWRSPRNRRAYRLEIDAGIRDGRLRMDWTCAVNDRETVERLAAGTLASLRALLALPEAVAAPAHLPAELPANDLARLLRIDPELEDAYPLSPLQQAMHLRLLQSPGSGEYFQQCLFLLRGPLDVPRFVRAWRRLPSRFETFRTSFHWDGLGRPLQVVHTGAELPVCELDWRGMSGQECAARLAELLDEDRRRGFDPVRPPLTRLAVIRMTDDAWQVVWSLHHLISDGWSLPLALGDVIAGYLSGDEPAPRAASRYRHFVEWLESRDPWETRAWWRRELRGFRAPTPLARREGGGPRAGSPGRAELLLPRATTARLEALCREGQLTLSAVLQGAWAHLLSRRAGTPDVLFGVAVSGRPAEVPGIESLVGCFINAVPFRVTVDLDVPLLPWLQDVQARWRENQSFDFSPLALVREESEVPHGRPLYDSVLVFENYPLDKGVLEALERRHGLVLEGFRFEEANDVPFTLMVFPEAELRLSALYDPGRFDAAAVQGILDQMAGLLRDFTRGPLASPDLPPIDPDTLRRAVESFNAPLA